MDRKRRALQREENTDRMELQQELPSATPVPDVVRCWTSKACDPRWLSWMTLKDISIPAKSAEPERVFSGQRSHSPIDAAAWGRCPVSSLVLKELAVGWAGDCN